jgi:hypothetical protein
LPKKNHRFGGYNLDELPSFYGVGFSRDIFCVHLLCFEYMRAVDFRRYRFNGNLHSIVVQWIKHSGDKKMASSFNPLSISASL